MEWSIYVPSGLLFGLAIAFGYSVIPGKMNYFSGRLLKYPTIAIIYSIVLVELIFYSAIRLFIVFVETAIASPTHRRLRTLMEQQTSYGDWYKVASQLDHSKGLTRWQDDLNDFTALHFNWDFLRHLIADMKLARKNQDASMGLAVLHQCIRKNIGGIFREELYSYTNTGEPKNLVIEFVDEVVTTLEWLTERDPEVDVTSLLDSARIIYGRTALCLSGGGMMALYHLGSVRALLIEGILPHIISGASAGALCAAFVCTRRDEELIRDLNPDILHPKFTCCSRTWSQRIRSYIKTGAMFDNDEWFELVKW